MIANDAEHLLKVGSIGGPYSQDAVCITRHRIRLGYFWDAAHHLPHPVWRDPALAVDLDERLDCPAQSRGLNFGCKTPDYAALAEPVHPSFGGCRGQSDMMPEHGKTLATVIGEPRKDLVIDFIKTQYSLLGFVDHTIGLALARPLPFKGDNHSAEALRTSRAPCSTSALPDVSADILRRGQFDQPVDGSKPPRRSCPSRPSVVGAR